MNATLASKVVTKNAARSQRRSVVVRAEETAAPKKEAPKAWTAPTLDPNTPSPIFGGSTGTFMIFVFSTRRIWHRDARFPPFARFSTC
jgi:hypothetical protein